MAFHDVLQLHSPFDGLLQNVNATEEDLDSYDSEYKQAVDHANIFMQKKITRVTKVCAPTLYGWFLVRKAEYESRGHHNCVKTLLHVTAASNIPSILKKNLDWRRVSRAKYGRGVSFANSSYYANKYATRSIGDKRAMIVADVLVGNTTRNCCSIPTEGYDTALGNTNVYVKFYDDEFYPKYIVYYNN